MGVWLSTLISGAVTVATPIITATVNSAVTTHATQLPETPAAQYSVVSQACQLANSQQVYLHISVPCYCPTEKQAVFYKLGSLKVFYVLSFSCQF